MDLCTGHKTHISFCRLGVWAKAMLSGLMHGQGSHAFGAPMNKGV